jgi:hypothetical protein
MRSPDDNRARLLYSAYTRKVENAVEAARASLASEAKCFPHEFYQAVEAVAHYLNDKAADPPAKKLLEVAIPLLRQGRPPKRERKRPKSDLSRELWITWGVASICREFGVAPTRNPETRGVECGASIVRKALRQLDVKLSERRIANIFAKHRHLYDELFEAVGGTGGFAKRKSLK